MAESKNREATANSILDGATTFLSTLYTQAIKNVSETAGKIVEAKFAVAFDGYAILDGYRQQGLYGAIKAGEGAIGASIVAPIGTFFGPVGAATFATVGAAAFTKITEGYYDIGQVIANNVDFYSVLHPDEPKGSTTMNAVPANASASTPAVVNSPVAALAGASPDIGATLSGTGAHAAVAAPGGHAADNNAASSIHEVTAGNAAIGITMKAGNFLETLRTADAMERYAYNTLGVASSGDSLDSARTISTLPKVMDLFANLTPSPVVAGNQGASIPLAGISAPSPATGTAASAPDTGINKTVGDNTVSAGLSSLMGGVTAKNIADGIPVNAESFLGSAQKVANAEENNIAANILAAGPANSLDNASMDIMPRMVVNVVTDSLRRMTGAASPSASLAQALVFEHPNAWYGYHRDSRGSYLQNSNNFEVGDGYSGSWATSNSAMERWYDKSDNDESVVTYKSSNQNDTVRKIFNFYDNNFLAGSGYSYSTYTEHDMLSGFNSYERHVFWHDSDGSHYAGYGSNSVKQGDTWRDWYGASYDAALDKGHLFYTSSGSGLGAGDVGDELKKNMQDVYKMWFDGASSGYSNVSLTKQRDDGVPPSLPISGLLNRINDFTYETSTVGLNNRLTRKGSFYDNVQFHNGSGWSSYHLDRQYDALVATEIHHLSRENTYMNYLHNDNEDSLATVWYSSDAFPTVPNYRSGHFFQNIAYDNTRMDLTDRSDEAWEAKLTPGSHVVPLGSHNR
ncbi:MAG TPA: hypothetical protein DEP05_06875 [Betaproteobacteria bacterium]|nr:hypothetical protein [Betaproteobacteria bacterium]